ncbi:MbtH family NRPS accessory protein [Nonomuraea sp. NPDC049141]|uniref:MbtH family protein n=1 Tax=unclassified Nonomuraea TaxID=2593643 RepID=UPI0033CA1F62
MSNDEIDDGRTYRVVLNDEEQYSIWPAGKELPAGWYAEGVEGTRDACLAHIGQVWTDMRPKSLRERMAAAAAVGDTVA